MHTIKLLIIALFALGLLSCEKEQQLPNPEISNFTDSRDEHVYQTVKIGEQWWMAENLAFLSKVSPVEFGSVVEPIYYVYDYNGYDPIEAKERWDYKIFGVLYNWEAAIVVCPNGWHLPTKLEWVQLYEYLSQNAYEYFNEEGSIGKALASNSLWDTVSYQPSEGQVCWQQYSNNTSGFNAFPGGRRYSFSEGDFIWLGKVAYFWSSSLADAENAWMFGLDYLSSGTMLAENYRQDGFSVRCLKNE
jgi:uncharacterized protein (TIGR02145 family)